MTDTSSDNEWYNGKQRMTTSDNECQRVVQRVTMKYNSGNEWQRVTTSDNERKRVAANDNEWQRVTKSGHSGLFSFFSNKRGTYHYAP